MHRRKGQRSHLLLNSKQARRKENRLNVFSAIKLIFQMNARRSAKVSVIANDGKKTILIQSLKHLIPLEIQFHHPLPDKQ